MSVERLLVAAGALSGLVAVAAGAFGAHALEGRVSPDLLPVFETAARYQMYHALALVGVGLAAARWGGGLWSWAGLAFLFGTLVFCGSLYVLSLAGIRWMGAVTPLGGLAFMAGWALVAIAALRGL